VNVIGGANAYNIFWQVAGSNVNIKTNANFVGTILAKSTINFYTGASILGRLLAQTAVNL